MLSEFSRFSSPICSGVMNTQRQKPGAEAISSDGSITTPHQGPDDEKMKALLKRTGYSLDVSRGQRKYGGPPPQWEGAVPGSGCEVFCGKIPKDMFEDKLITLKNVERSGT
jgi:heterogeneous nuclear ribonucleoprotein R